tara:strand:- start:414 stop:1616 length:1203 start_codon:yes stop_codon:yes gene_type:complete
MREALKTRISKYGPKTNASMTIENVQGKGLQLVVIYAGRKHYLPLSSVPLNPDEHANHPNHQKIKVNHNGKVGIGTANPAGLLEISSSTADEPNIIIENTSTSQQAGGDIEFRTADTDTNLGDNIVLGEILFEGWNITGSDWEVASRITCRKDGATGGNNDMGGELAFYTTADGSSDSTTQRMCIREDGKVGIGDTDPSARLTLGGSMALTTGDGSDMQIAYQDTRDSYGMAKIHFSDGGQISLYNGDGSGAYTVKAKLAVDGGFYITSLLGASAATGPEVEYNTTSKELSYESSDAALKTNIQAIPYGLAEINQLKPCMYDMHSWRIDMDEDGNNTGYTKSESPESMGCIGMIAQEVAESMPKLLAGDVLKSYKRKELVTVMVKAIQELSDKVTALENK